MSPRQLGYATVAILAALDEGARYGLDIMSRAELPSGTVYPTLSRLEKRGYVRSVWESAAIADREGRPRRRYYEMTAAGGRALSAARRAFRSLTDESTAARSLARES